MKKIINKIPVGVFSVIATIIVVTLLLIPSQQVHSSWFSWFHFKHSDKVVHVILFLFLNGVYLYDYTKLCNPHHTQLNKELAITVFAAMIGLITEALQLTTGWGRNFDQLDIVADIVGALIAFGLMKWCGSHLLRKYVFNVKRTHRHRHYNHDEHNEHSHNPNNGSQNG